MKTRFKSVVAMQKEVTDSVELQDAIKNDPGNFFNNLEIISPIKKPWVFITVVCIIGLALILCVVFMAVITLAEPNTIITMTEGVVKKSTLVVELPQIFGVIASTAIGAIAGLLVPSPVGNK